MTGFARAASLSILVAIAATGASAQDGGERAFHRDPQGRQWVVASDGFGGAALLRYDSAGVLLSSIALSGSGGDGDYGLASDPAGDAWVAGAVSTGAQTGLGVWHASADGSVLLSSTAYFGERELFAPAIAVDASSRVWVAGAEQTSDGETFRHILWRFESDASLAAGFPVFHQRAGGSLDGGLSIAVDSSGDIWTAGVSSDPATGAFDLALWKHDSSGTLRAGFPVYRASAYANLEGLGSDIVIAAGEKAWVSASHLFAGCSETAAALYRFDMGGTLELQRFWSDAAQSRSSLERLTLDSGGAAWAVGRSSEATAVWLYDGFGRLENGYPQAVAGLSAAGIAVDGGDIPWVLVNSVPTAFVGGIPLSGSEGPPACAVLATGTISGQVTVAGGLPAGALLTVAASADAFGEDLRPLVVESTGGASVPYSIPVPTPGDYSVGAFVGDDAEGIQASTPIGFYRGMAQISLAADASFSGADFEIAPDTTPPTLAITYPVDGSTIGVLSLLEGTARDDKRLEGLSLAVEDLTAGRWLSQGFPVWSASTAPIYHGTGDDPFLGLPVDTAWEVALATSGGPCRTWRPISSLGISTACARRCATSPTRARRSRQPPSSGTARRLIPGPSPRPSSTARSSVRRARCGVGASRRARRPISCPARPRTRRSCPRPPCPISTRAFRPIPTPGCAPEGWTSASRGRGPARS